ncbi:MAG: M15 family metallopeptidase [Lachnospiraceae bacterium]|nr:M15 family metallopeptidase [Lachnospiraceae bacterium]
MILFLVALVLGIAGYWFFQNEPTVSVSSDIHTADSPAAASVSTSAVSGSALLPEDISTILDNSDTVPLDTIPNSITALVNRNYLLPAAYTPSDLTEPNILFSFSFQGDKRKMRKIAADALEKLFNAGRKKGVILYGVSGYRSYQRQKQIYDGNVATRGVSATDAVSATPGSSEHQSGLAIDVSARSVDCRLDQSFGDTKEGRWLAKNAHKYGYIVRYPYGKSKVTGYHYEPWHIRYVGITVATYLYKNKLTLEEYYGVSCNKPEEDTGVDVEEPDEVKYATPKPTKKSSGTPAPTKK